jgi:hypothetical protein
MSIAMALVLLSGTAAKAQGIDFTLTSPAYQTAAPGAIVAFDACRMQILARMCI